MTDDIVRQIGLAMYPGNTKNRTSNPIDDCTNRVLDALFMYIDPDSMQEQDVENIRLNVEYALADFLTSSTFPSRN